MLTQVETPEDRWLQRRGRIGREKQAFEMFYLFANVSGATPYETSDLIRFRDWTDVILQTGRSGIELNELMYQPPPLHEARMRENLSRAESISFSTVHSKVTPYYAPMYGYGYRVATLHQLEACSVGCTGKGRSSCFNRLY